MKQHREGFSLLEVVVILLVIGLIGIAAIPSSKMIYKEQTKKLAKEMALDLYQQRKQSVTTRTTGCTYLTSSSTLGPYDGYALTPANLTASGGMRNKEQETWEHIKITMEATSPIPPTSRTITAVYFDEKGYMVDMVDGTGDEITTLTIKINHDDIQTQIVIDGLTGHSVISGP